jgi:ABC-type phosphate transport system substrate-binding protein
MLRTAVALVFLTLAAHAAHAAEVVVIVNAANPTASMDAKAVKSHFLKSTPTWGHGEKIRPVDLEGPERTTFIAKVLGMSATDLERYWIEKQYASGDNPPTKAPDEAGVIKLVKTFKGGIGFVTREAAAAAGADVKVVLSLP